MRFYTKEESEAWLSGHGRLKPDLVPGVRVERIEYPPMPYRVGYIAHWIATTLTYGQPTLLLMTEWSIWPSSENWHLYYRLRQSYGDQRLLAEAPGHLCLGHEAEDLASFLEVAMLNGWGGYILTHANYHNAFFSHDEYIDFFNGPTVDLENIRRGLGPDRLEARNRS